MATVAAAAGVVVVVRFLVDEHASLIGRRRYSSRRPRAVSKDARAVLGSGSALPGPLAIKLGQLAALQYQLVQTVETLVQAFAGDGARRLHLDAGTTRHGAQLQYAELLLELFYFFGT